MPSQFRDLRSNDEPMWGNVGSELNKLFANQGWNPDFGEIGSQGGGKALLPALQQAMALQNERSRQASAERIAAMNQGTNFDVGMMDALGRLLNSRISMRNADLDRVLKEKQYASDSERWMAQEKGKDRRSEAEIENKRSIAEIMAGSRLSKLPTPPKLDFAELNQRAATALVEMKKVNPSITLDDAKRAVEQRHIENWYKTVGAATQAARNDMQLPFLMSNAALSPEKIAVEDMPTEIIPGLQLMETKTQQKPKEQVPLLPTLSMSVQPAEGKVPAQTLAALPMMDVPRAPEQLRGNPLPQAGRMSVNGLPIEEVQYNPGVPQSYAGTGNYGNSGIRSNPDLWHRNIDGDSQRAPYKDVPLSNTPQGLEDSAKWQSFFDEFGITPEQEKRWKRPISQVASDMQDEQIKDSLYNEAFREARRQRRLQQRIPGIQLEEFDSPSTMPSPLYGQKPVTPQSYLWKGSVLGKSALNTRPISNGPVTPRSYKTWPAPEVQDFLSGILW